MAILKVGEKYIFDIHYYLCIFMTQLNFRIAFNHSSYSKNLVRIIVSLIIKQVKEK